MKQSRAWIVVAVVVVLAIAGIVALGRWAVRAPGRAADALVERAVAPREKQIDLGTLVLRVRELSRLETASMRVMHVSTITQSRGVIPDAIAGDAAGVRSSFALRRSHGGRGGGRRSPEGPES